MPLDVLYGGDCPIVFTGAIRPASAPGADGPANLADAVALARSSTRRRRARRGRRLRRARPRRPHVRKVDSTAAEPFGSPHGGPDRGRPRGPGEHRDASRSAARRSIPSTWTSGSRSCRPWLGDDGALLRAVAADGRRGLRRRDARRRPPRPARARGAARGGRRAMPVVATTRPERGSILYETYGFEG